MKALLFASLLVAFMCEDPVTSLQCYTCGEIEYMCDWRRHCWKGQRFCVTSMQLNGKPSQVTKGCAWRCTGKIQGILIECCTTDFCNQD
ncbi:three-fingered toxin-11 [Crotalus adamanteus]|uniref:Three-fingered toxin-11 n=1 Tax=Crotalus adamanteus TaxID=8729 RepID=A0AAW1BMA5_CROAD